jgi:hypothetical protein
MPLNLKGVVMLARHSASTGIGASLVVALLILWLAIGAIAAGQRHYYSNSSTSCAKVGTISVTILAGPLNYAGANPKVKSCQAPQPSK